MSKPVACQALICLIRCSSSRLQNVSWPEALSHNPFATSSSADRIGLSGHARSNSGDASRATSLMPAHKMRPRSSFRANARAACFRVHKDAARFPLSTVETNFGSSGRRLVLEYQFRTWPCSLGSLRTLSSVLRVSSANSRKREIAEVDGCDARVQKKAEIRRR